MRTILSLIGAALAAYAVTFGGLGNLRPDLKTYTTINLKNDKIVKDPVERTLVFGDVWHISPFGEKSKRVRVVYDSWQIRK